MKLFELITPANLGYRDSKLSTDAHERLLTRAIGADRKRVGHGAFARVWSSDKKPGEVTKVAKEFASLNKDAYYQYLDMISRNERMSSNPYFPKVNRLRVVKGRDGGFTYTADIESLHPLESLGIEELEAIGEHTFNDFDGLCAIVAKSWGKYKTDGRPTEDEQSQRTEIRKVVLERTILVYLGKAMWHSTGVATYIRDPNLKQAVMMIRHLIKSNPGIGPDIHSGNVMVRRGRFMPQLVFTDPVC